MSNKISSEEKEIFNRYLTEYESELDEKIKCKTCKGKFKNCKKCHGIGRIHANQIFANESIKGIIKRLETNLEFEIKSQIKEDFLYCIKQFFNKKRVIPKKIRNPIEGNYYSIDNFIEKSWKNSKQHNYPKLISIFISYFLREPSRNQIHIIKQIIGFTSFAKLGIDYYEYYKLLDSKEKITENEFRTVLIIKLAHCISKGYENYDFDEKEVLKLNRESKKILFGILEKDNSDDAKNFIKQWRKSIEQQFEDYYEISEDKDWFIRTLNNIHLGKDPFEGISPFVKKDQNGWKFSKPEDTEIEYKSTIFASRSVTEKQFHNIKKLKPIEVLLRENDLQYKDKILQTIVAFLNTDGGKIFIGVEDDGKIRGIEALTKNDIFWKKTNRTKNDVKFLDDFTLEINSWLKNKNQASINQKYNDKLITNHNIQIPSNPKKNIHLIDVKRPSEIPDSYFNVIKHGYTESSESVGYIRKNGMNKRLDDKEWNEYTKNWKR